MGLFFFPSQRKVVDEKHSQGTVAATFIHTVTQLLQGGV